METVPTDVLRIIFGSVRHTNVLRAVCRLWRRVIPPSAPDVRPARIFNGEIPPGMPIPIASYDHNRRDQLPSTKFYFGRIDTFSPSEKQYTNSFSCGDGIWYSCSAYKKGMPFLNCLCRTHTTEVEVGRLAYLYMRNPDTWNLFTFESQPEFVEVNDCLPTVALGAKNLIVSDSVDMPVREMRCEKLSVTVWSNFNGVSFPNLHTLFISGWGSDPILVAENLPKLRHLAIHANLFPIDCMFHVEELTIWCNDIRSALAFIEKVRPSVLTVVCRDGRPLTGVCISPIILRLQCREKKMPLRESLPGYIKCLSVMDHDFTYWMNWRTFTRMSFLNIHNLFSHKN